MIVIVQILTFFLCLFCVFIKRVAAAIFRVPCVGGQKPFSADGAFPRDVYKRQGLDLCETEKPDLLLATDPDCDRVGIAVPHAGSYLLLTGNEVGVLLTDYIASSRIELGTMPQNPIVVKTIAVSYTHLDVYKRQQLFLRFYWQKSLVFWRISQTSTM